MRKKENGEILGWFAAGFAAAALSIVPTSTPAVSIAGYLLGSFLGAVFPLLSIRQEVADLLTRKNGHGLPFLLGVRVDG
jgi:hypothetical protein